ncbi:MAG: cytochrome b6-f complex subunit PetL [Cyanobacteria bacterium P01_F01_bin.53]
MGGAVIYVVYLAVLFTMAVGLMFGLRAIKLI